MADTSRQRVPPPSRYLLRSLRDDRLLRGAFAVCVLLIGYQLSVTLLQPPWIKPVTDWLRTGLAWPQLLVVALLALHLLRTHQPGTATWWCVTLGLLSYTVGRTLWTLADVFVYPQGVPFPSLPDLFFILQYPWFVAAVFLIPAEGRWLPGLRVIVDGLLWMSAVTALSWYFVLLPLSLQTRESQVSKSISMYYQVVDLALFYGLVAALARPRRTTGALVVLSLLGLAMICLFVADTWAALLLLHQPYTYRSGSVPDLFWFSCYLLIPLAAVARWRLMVVPLPSGLQVVPAPLGWPDVLACAQFVLPSVVAVAASMVIIVDATATSRSTTILVSPEAVGVILLVLAILRSAVTYLEREQLRRERDAARLQEGATWLANERMAAYMGTVAHELKTPLTSLTGNLQLMPRRLDTLLRRVANHEDYADAARVLRALIDWCAQSLERMRRRVDDVLDETRLSHGRLALRLQPCDLVSVVGRAVAEQLALNPERSIHWVVDTAPIAVLADASRIEQVVTNYVGNALKFSHADRAVEVRVQVQNGQARVAVRDEGIGIPPGDQPHIWERFYQAEGAGWQSGSQIGFGLGLYLSKAIVEGHHGQVGVESAPGRGTTIWFALPVAPSPTGPAPEAAADSSVSLPAPTESSDYERLRDGYDP
jgi:signal transduction histidine kinase